jgi:hypothetical protein
MHVFKSYVLKMKLEALDAYLNFQGCRLNP